MRCSEQKNTAAFVQRWLFLSNHKDRNTLYLSFVAIAAIISMVLIVFAIVYFSVFCVSNCKAVSNFSSC
jgi:hypothetical protein